jgi:hypothetical protein
MKKSFLALAVAGLFAAGALFAAETKTENKVAGCCATAAKDGKTCTHACCIEAAKAGNNCTKCGGAGKVEKPAEAKK